MNAKNEAEFLKQFSEKLKSVRKEKNINLSALSDLTGINEKKLKTFEAGKEAPAIADIINLAAGLKISSGYFFLSKISDEQVEVVRAAERWTVERISEGATSF